MELNVVTKVKNSDVIKKTKAIAAKSMDVLKKPRSTQARRPPQSAVTKEAVQDAAYTQAYDDASHARHSAAAAKPRLSHMVARGKDLVSADATSVAAVAAIVVGAALIEVELIPGLIIGAGAVLLSKLFPEMGDYVRPAIKGALRTGFVLAHKAQELMAETSEQVHDLMAEVMQEQKHPHVTKKMQPVSEQVREHAPKA
jgi:hypothetical protein